jgi:hypothetical protein
MEEENAANWNWRLLSAGQAIRVVLMARMNAWKWRMKGRCQVRSQIYLSLMAEQHMLSQHAQRPFFQKDEKSVRI